MSLSCLGPTFFNKIRVVHVKSIKLEGKESMSDRQSDVEMAQAPTSSNKVEDTWVSHVRTNKGD